MKESLPIGSCFFGHKWTKWEQYSQEMLNPTHNVKYFEAMQKRIKEETKQLSLF